MMVNHWWCLLCVSALFASVLGTIHWKCLKPNVQKCESQNVARFKSALKDNNYQAMCESVEELIDCAQIDCGGESWDPTDDFLTKLKEYSEATGLCGDEAQTNACAVNLSKTCMKTMAKFMVRMGDPCIFYGMYAGCIIKGGSKCGDDTTTAYMSEMDRQIREKMPTVFGSTTVDMCPRWPRMYQMFLRQRG
ncbi:uncharacterized protein LOC135482132 [Liolophura sinensis]|uniref:uncharacterized protein LOC135482132 n=1 Tax=Liolophura sinensis TaxID=3198878 RepID=UPI00315950BF